ncbi:MAG: hypothetical protein H6925_03245 [Holosporaceae bacterium]|nr:MAG: hypothetical protein H6925_03245 [Holosporaceae bacterium]
MADGQDKFDRHIERLRHQKKRTHYFKYALLAILALLLLVAFMWPKLQSLSLLFLEAKIGGVQVDATRINLRKKFVENPKFVGGGDRPYTVVAKKAQQTSKKEVVLTDVTGRFTLKDGNVLSVVANMGIIHMGTQLTGTLKGDVNFIYDRGNTEIWTDNVFVNMKEGTLDNNEVVEGVSQFGALKSRHGIHIKQKESFLRLKGSSDLVIIPEQKGQKNE